VQVEEKKKHHEQEYVVSGQIKRSGVNVNIKGGSLKVKESIQGLYAECLGIYE